MRRNPYQAVVLPLLVALLVGLDVLSPFDTRAYDQLMRLQQATPPPEILLVSIDGESERRYPEFIERRPLALARLVHRLNQVKPRVIGAYIAFDPRDPRDRDGLPVLREALAEHGRTVGKAFTIDEPNRSAERAFVETEQAGFHTIGLQLIGVGDDNVVRGAFYAAPLAGALRSSFAMAVLQEAGDLLPEPRRAALQAAMDSPTVEEDFYPIAFFGGAGTIRTVRAADVLDGTVHPDVWRDRIVIIGQAEQDHQINLTTSVSPWASEGLTVDEFEAQAAAALMTGRVFRSLPPWGAAAVVGGLLLAFAALLARVRQHRVLPAAIVAMAAIGIAYVSACFALFWLPPVALFVALPMQLGIELSQRYSRAAAQLAAEIAVLRREAAPSAAATGRFDVEQALLAVREAIASIRQQREYVHRLIDVQPAAIVVVDGQQRVRLCNAQALAWRSDPDAPTGTLRDWLAAVRLALPGELSRYVGTGSARLLARAGDRDVIVAVEPLPTGRGRDQHDTLVCVTEVSSLVVEQAERQAAIDFLSHDLRAPAHALIDLCEGAQQDPGLAPQTRQILHTAERLSRRLVQMATTYLDFVRSASPEAFTRNDPVLLADVVLEAIETCAPEAVVKSLKLDVAVEGGEDGWVTGDAALLRRAVENLLTNAVKVTATGGRIEVRLERRGASMAIIVRDEGPGIAPARRSQIFQRFGPQAGKVGGGRSVGLGLAMVMSVVARHRGLVFVDDRPEGGAEFRIELPLEVEAAAG
ncbi:MAG: CHASE2 domain-containing protein [Lysobacteraceae bacterium]|jgi:signal transduction histidine kinase/CHASE2 domain-containing sensor protein|nr:CHASE2 and HATPase_c domain-containing protein [Xanthomonadaceae bacterium]MCZ8319562.1 CHASE2 and HATPase_c domain-containing protein [Silanimonas sp.]